MGIRVVAIEHDAALEKFLGLAGVPLLSEGDRDVIVSHGILGVLLNHFLENLDGFAESPLAAIDIRQVYGGEHIAGHDPQGFFESDQGGGDFARMNLGDREIGKSEGIVGIFVVELLVDFFRIGETAFTNQRAGFLDELPGFRAEGLRARRGLVGRLCRAIGGLGNGHGNTHIHLAGIVHHDQRIPENQNLAIAELRGRLRKNSHLR